MEFDRLTTGGIFLALIVVGVVGTSLTPMQLTTVLMMVAPSMAIFGLICLVLGVKHGEFRATR